MSTFYVHLLPSSCGPMLLLIDDVSTMYESRRRNQAGPSFDKLLVKYYTSSQVDRSEGVSQDGVLTLSMSTAACLMELPLLPNESPAEYLDSPPSSSSALNLPFRPQLALHNEVLRRVCMIAGIRCSGLAEV